jgi:valyl-tRNA synthetase
MIIFQGLPRFELREKMIQFLRDNNLLNSILPHQMSVPRCSRSGDVIEPLLRPQVSFVNLINFNLQMCGHI